MASALRSSVNFRLCLFAHVVIFAWYVFTLKANSAIASSGRHPGARSYGGRWKYLTFINLVMQAVFFGVCVVCDLIPTALLTALRDFLFTALAFPVGTFVFTSFWSIYAYDRELVFPKVLDDIIPAWLNHAMHTVILPLLLVQMFLQNHRYPSRSRGIVTLALFAALYLSWVLWVRHVSGIWVYPLMAQFSAVGLVVFLSAASLSMAPLYLLGEKLTRIIWGPSAGNLNRKKK